MIDILGDGIMVWNIKYECKGKKNTLIIEIRGTYLKYSK